jgi:hypothetical protein
VRELLVEAGDCELARSAGEDGGGACERNAAYAAKSEKVKTEAPTTWNVSVWRGVAGGAV